MVRLCAKLNEKTKEIEYLKNQLISCIRFDVLDYNEKLIAVNITSEDSRINFPIICKINSQFIDIERKLYQKYPEYGANNGQDNLFLFNGKQVNRFKTMEQNDFHVIDITLTKNNLDAKI